MEDSVNSYVGQQIGMQCKTSKGLLSLNKTDSLKTDWNPKRQGKVKDTQNAIIRKYPNSET